MLQRTILCGLLLYGATTIDVGFPTWIPSAAYPSFLSLLLLMFCQCLQGAELVAWAGLIGMSFDFLTDSAPGAGIMVAASIALFVAWQRSFQGREKSLLDRLAFGMVLLLVLALAQGGRILLRNPEAPLPDLAVQLFSNAAATFLLFVAANSLWSVVRLFFRRTYNFEGKYV